jgi:hypothetical protein
MAEESPILSYADPSLIQSRWRNLTIGLAIAAIALLAAFAGVWLRREIFVQTQDIRFVRNVANAYLWGRNARAVGVFDIYHDVETGQLFPWYFELDYPPLRLLTVTIWQGWTERQFSTAPREWQGGYEFTKPMLWTDTISAMFASLFAFLLIWMWINRQTDASPGAPPRTWRGPLCGLAGALLLWFNPAILWDGYVWVQWDIWPIPFFLAAVFFACLDCWFVAGISLAIGACLKGQALLVLPVMLLWPLFRLRFGALGRIAAGMALMFMIIAFPWMKPTTAAFRWYLLMLVATGLIAPIALRWKLDRRWMIGCALMAVLLCWPWRSDALIWRRFLPAALLGVVAMARFLPPRALPYVYSFGVAAAVAMMIPLFNARTEWFTTGFVYGAEHRKIISMAGTYNLPTILQNSFDWKNDALHDIDGVPLVGSVPLRKMMIWIYGGFLLLCAFAAARLEKRSDPRFLIAISLPWFLFYLLLTQMFCRYLVYGAAMCALLPATGLGVTLLGVIVGVIGLLGIMENHYQLASVFPDAQSWLPQMDTLEALDPGIGWALLLIAAIFLYTALVPRTRLAR